MTAWGQTRTFDDVGLMSHVAPKADIGRHFMMGWTPPTALMCQGGGVEHHLREGSVSEAIIIGLDIAKYVFHAHGVDGRGRAIFSKRITRRKLVDFFTAQPSCTVALEACGGAHHWARLLTQLGHEVRLIPPAYVKPFVKRQKNDAIDAEAICEAVQRPSMQFHCFLPHAPQQGYSSPAHIPNRWLSWWPDEGGYRYFVLPALVALTHC